MLTVADVAALPGLGLVLAAGAAGAGRPVRWAASTELDDPTPWLEGGELLLATGLALGDGPALRAYVARLDARGLAGLGLGLGFRFDAPPPELVDEAERRGFPVLLVPYATPFVAITKAVMGELANAHLAAVERALAVHDELIDLVLAEAGADALVAATARATGARVALVDAAGRVTASAGLPEDEAAALAAAALAGGAPDEAADGLLALPVGLAGRREATLAVAPAAPLDEAGRLALRHARTVLALELLKERAVADTERRLAGDVIADVAGGAPGPTLARTLRAFGLDAADGLAVIHLRPLDAGAVPTTRLVHAVAERLAGRGLASVRDGAVCVLVAARDDAAAEAEARELAERYDARAGLGRVRTDPGELAAAHEEAGLALEAAAARDGEARVATHRDLGTLGLLLALGDDAALRRFCDAVLGDIERAEPRFAPALLASADALIGAGGRWADAASALGVHRHTLRYRMRRLEELTGRRLDDAADRLDLSLALRAREVLGRRAAEREHGAGAPRR